jgi:hypothetical protein
LCQSIPNAFKKKSRFDNVLHEFRLSRAAERLVPIFRITPNLFLSTRERKMAPRESISIGPFEAEGPRTTRYIVIIVAAALAAAFYLGKLSALFDSCFGIKL